MIAVVANRSFTINDWRVDPELNGLSRADEVVKIDPQNMKVLELLASRPGEVISQSEIEEAAMGWRDSHAELRVSEHCSAKTCAWR